MNEQGHYRERWSYDRSERSTSDPDLKTENDGQAYITHDIKKRCSQNQFFIAVYHCEFSQKRGDGSEDEHEPGEEEVSLFYSYLSILSVGLKKDKNLLLEYTVYQLIDEFRRYSAKDNYDLYIKLKIAGAKDLDEVKNWKGSLNKENFDY